MTDDALKYRQLAGERVEARVMFFLTQYGPAEALKMGDCRIIAMKAREVAFDEFDPKDKP